MKIKEMIDNLDPRKKRLIVVTTITLGLVGLLALGYHFRGSSSSEQNIVERPKKISLDTKLLEKTYAENITRELERRSEEVEELKRLIESLKREVKEGKKTKPSPLPPPPSNKGDKIETGKTSRPVEVKKSKPPYPPSPMSLKNQPNRMVEASKKLEEKVEMVGGIEYVSVKKDDRVKKEGEKPLRTIYLPPSFMEATLLTGFSAATMQGAKTYEKPLLLRIRDLAVLPNEIKANLKGCFVIASAYGDLSDERAHARLVNLSCIDRRGNAVIDESIKGFIVDEDGKIGLAGDVVTKMGALLGRSIIAGFFGGIGDAFQASATTQSISALGTTQTIKSEDMLKAGIGGGLGQGFKELQNFYLEMARQTFPVVEVGAAKTVTVVIEEGVELKIRNYNCIGGFEGCEED